MRVRVEPRRDGDYRVRVEIGGDVEAIATRELEALGGWLDGRNDDDLVYTVPLSAGLPAISAAAATLRLGRATRPASAVA